MLSVGSTGTLAPFVPHAGANERSIAATQDTIVNDSCLVHDPMAHSSCDNSLRAHLQPTMQRLIEMTNACWRV